MKKILFIIFIISQYLNSQTLNNLTIEEKEFINNYPIINVGAETDWPPFDFVENGNYIGFAKDYLDVISKKTGLKFNYDIDTWPNLLKKAKEKKVDLLPILAKTPQREEFLLYTQNYLTIRDYVFSNDKTIKSINDLNNKTVAIPKGYAQEHYFSTNHPDIKIYSSKNPLDSIDAVITNKADVFVSNIAIVNYLTKEHSISNIFANFSMSYEGNNMHMATRNDLAILRDIIQKALNSFTVEEKTTILNKWMSRNINEKSFTLTKKEKDYIKEKKSIVIANEYDWIPYDYYENNIPKGFVIDYVKLICEKIGIEPLFITDSWDNIVKRFKNKEIDVLPVVSYSKKRDEYLNYTKDYIKQDFAIVSKSSKENIVNFDDLKNKKLGLVKNWNSTNMIRESYPEINVIEFESLKDIFEAIKNNFIDATIQNRLIANYYVNRSYKSYLDVGSSIKIKNFNSNLHMGVREDLDILYSIFNKTISTVTENEVKFLENKWLNISDGLVFSKEELDFINNKVINVAYTANWEPFSFINNGQPYGLGFDFWQFVVEKANLKVNTTFKTTFSSALDDIKNKSEDIIITTSKTEDRLNYSIFSDVYYKTPIGIASLLDKNYIADASHLLGKKVGVGKNYTAHKLLKEKYPNMNFVFVNSVQDGLKKLSHNEIDFLVDNMPVLAHNIQKHAYSDIIKISGSTGIDFKLQMMIRDDYVVLQSIINKVLSTMTPEDKKIIYEKWGSITYEKGYDFSIIWQISLPLFIILFIVTYKNRQLVKYQKNLERTQNNLENTLKNFKDVVNLTIEAILVVKDEKIVFNNNEAEKIFEINSDDILNKKIDELFAKKENETTIFNVLDRKDSKTYEINALKSKSNDMFPTLVKCKEIIFNGKKSVILSIIDLSDIKQKENLLIQQSKMASLGEMIANIAHQWRQPLSYISIAASGMKFQKEYGELSDKDFNSTIDNITQTTSFLSQTIDDFQNYITNEKFEKRFNINSSIEKILNIIKGAFVNHFIEVRLNLSENLVINSYQNELNQVLLNILNNSKDALKEIDKDERFICIKTYKRGNFAYIEIIDNAGGVDPKILDKIFEPYFTTKHKSQGTGLGLYMTHKIVTESMKGEICMLNVGHTFEEKYFDKCAKVQIKLPISL